VSRIAGLAIWVLGLGSVFSFNIFADANPLGFLGIEGTFFYLIDFTVANVMLPVNALLIALFAGWAVRKSTVVEEFANTSDLWITFWRIANRYVAPVAIGIVLVDLLFGIS
jgi:NSS family neurotransmitter:Na+ symporter